MIESDTVLNEIVFPVLSILPDANNSCQTPLDERPGDVWQQVLREYYISLIGIHSSDLCGNKN